MSYWIILFVFLVLQCVQGIHTEDECSTCVGEQFECINGFCYCSNGYVPDYHQTDCVKCPGLGEKCYGPCCSSQNNDTLQCWFGVCKSCYGVQGNWICRESMDQIVMVSGSQIVMVIALVFGIIITFSLLYKLCAITNLRQLRQSNENRLSIGSLQIYVNERLRDAPPKYSRAAPAGSSIYPASVYLNAGFVHDNSLPPPPYSPENKNESNTTIHI